MNWRAAGVTLVVLALVMGPIGLLAGHFVEASTGDQAKWAWDCFTGVVDGCVEQGQNNALVRQWTDNGFYLAIGAAVVGMMGAGLWVGSATPQRAPQPVSDEGDSGDCQLTDEEAAEAEAIERELSLRGVRLK